MSEKASKSLTGVGAAVPNKMRLYATWVDRTPSNCIPRLCSLTLTRLQILRPLGSDIATISIAVKMQSSKRTLRSNELVLPSNGLLDTPLDVTFCLQYPHFLKRDGNRLHIFLQRRKRYKNRTMLGFKTLAEGVIRMDQVLQKPLDLDLELITDAGGKDKVSSPCARLYILQLSSTPVDQQEYKSEREHDFSDDDDEISSGEEEVGDLSDSEPIRTKLPHTTRHNLKQRFVSLLRRFRVPDSEGGRAADLHNQSDIQALFHELESLSCDEDSGPEQDTMSVSSTPKPSLRPFFSSSKSLLDSNNSPYIESEKIGDEKTASGSDGNTDVCFTDPEVQSDTQASSPPRDSSASAQRQPVRKGFYEQLSRLLSPEENVLPECVMLITGPESVTSTIATRLISLQKTIKVFQPTSSVEVKALLTALYAKINKYCNSCSKPGTIIKIVLVGGETLIGWFVRPYVEILSSKPLEWLSYARIFFVPLGTCGVSRQLAVLDPGYNAFFSNETDYKSEEFTQKLLKYTSVSLSASLAQLPIAEAMLTCCDETSQLFIPFVNEVRVGPTEHMLSVSVDMDDCSSPPAPSLTPPSSPNVQVRESPWEPLELQIDYWQMPKYNESIFKIEKDRSKQDGKMSIKGQFRGLQVSPTSTCGLCLNMYMASKEKKQKIMRLGKKKEKEKDIEPRNQNVEGVSRLICSARAAQTTPLKVYIDGVEFSSVKFFQLSSTWQSHVKNLTVSLVGTPMIHGAPLASTEAN